MYLEQFARKMHKIADAGRFDEFDPEEASFGRQLKAGQLPVQQGPGATVAAKPSAKASVAARPTGTPPPVPLSHQKTLPGPAPAAPIPSGRTMPGGALRPKLTPLTPMSAAEGTIPGMGAAVHSAAPAAAPAAAAASGGVVNSAKQMGKSMGTGWAAAGKSLASGGAKFMERPGMAMKMLKNPALSTAARVGGAARMVAPHAGILGAGLLAGHALLKKKEPQPLVVKTGGALLLEKTAISPELLRRAADKAANKGLMAKLRAVGAKFPNIDPQRFKDLEPKLLTRESKQHFKFLEAAKKKEAAAQVAKVRAKYSNKQASYDHENC